MKSLYWPPALIRASVVLSVCYSISKTVSRVGTVLQFIRDVLTQFYCVAQKSRLQIATHINHFESYRTGFYSNAVRWKVCVVQVDRKCSASISSTSNSCQHGKYSRKGRGYPGSSCKSREKAAHETQMVEQTSKLELRRNSAHNIQLGQAAVYCWFLLLINRSNPKKT